METANRHHANRPTRITAADHIRMAAAIARYDARMAAAERAERVAAWVGRALVLILSIVTVTVWSV